MLSKNTKEVWWLNPGVVPTPTDFVGLKNTLLFFLESKNDNFLSNVNVFGWKIIGEVAECEVPVKALYLLKTLLSKTI